MIKRDDCVLLTIDEFCKVKNITKMTFYNRKYNKTFPRKRIGKFKDIAFPKDKIIYVDNQGFLHL